MATATAPASRLSVGVTTVPWEGLGDAAGIVDPRRHWAHVDLMDGQFCPELTAGAPLVAAVARLGLTVDAHVMVEEPRRLLEDFVSAGASVITVHAEATRHLHRTLTELSALADAHSELVRGVALNPGTPVEVIEPVLHLVDLVLLLTINPGWRGQSPEPTTAGRVRRVRSLAAQEARHVLVGVDGGVTLANADEMATWGPDLLVSGSAVFGSADPAETLSRLEASISRATRQPTPE